MAAVISGEFQPFFPQTALETQNFLSRSLHLVLYCPEIIIMKRASSEIVKPSRNPVINDASQLKLNPTELDYDSVSSVSAFPSYNGILFFCLIYTVHKQLRYFSRSNQLLSPSSLILPSSLLNICLPVIFLLCTKARCRFA